MGKKLFWRFLSIGILIAFGLSALSLLFLNRYAQNNATRHRDEFILLWAQAIGRDIQIYTTEELRTHSEIMAKNAHPPRMPFPPGTLPPPPPGFDTHGGPPPPPPDFEHGEAGAHHPGNPQPPPPPELWILNDQGDVIISTQNKTYDFNWRTLQKSDLIGELKVTEDFFRLFTPFFTVKLPTRDGSVYLVMKDRLKPFFMLLLLSQALLTFATIVVALGLALLLTFLYLRKQSQEASQVLRRLEQGDLKARFPIKKFDEFGGLLLDFNRMAEEIEKLVNRIYMVESTRKNLLQELSHDFRTPLTTIRTTVETLKTFSEKMSVDDKKTVYGMLEDEMIYMNELFEKLMTIASLDEPHYKKTTSLTDLYKMIEDEIAYRKTSSHKLNWSLENHFPGQPYVSGDDHLLLRMIKNAFDNAARFARSEVKVSVQKKDQHLDIIIEDNGPGLNEKALKNFGVRREFSGREMQSQNHYSLGLGSVIMKSIVELHGGQLSISNKTTGDGALLILSLPLPQS
jgi:signal transduction histidine kinase